MLSSTERNPDSFGHRVLCDGSLQRSAPPASDVEYSRTRRFDQAIPIKVDLCGLGALEPFTGFARRPECAGVEEMLVEPQLEEVVFEIIVRLNCLRRGTLRDDIFVGQGSGCRITARPAVRRCHRFRHADILWRLY